MHAFAVWSKMVERFSYIIVVQDLRDMGEFNVMNPTTLV
jgi:hypothetical protein